MCNQVEPLDYDVTEPYYSSMYILSNYITSPVYNT